MGNYELLPSVNLSCKNSLQREIHFRSDAKPSSKRARQGRGAAGGGQEGEMPGGTQTLHVVPRPQAQSGWVGFFSISFLMKAVLICLHYLCVSGAPGSY